MLVGAPCWAPSFPGSKTAALQIAVFRLRTCSRRRRAAGHVLCSSLERIFSAFAFAIYMLFASVRGGRSVCPGLYRLTSGGFALAQEAEAMLQGGVQRFVFVDVSALHLRSRAAALPLCRRPGEGGAGSISAFAPLSYLLARR